MSFGAPMMLWGLLALAVPVVVHLFNFRRYRKVYFSNVERLTALQTESRHTSTVRRWLVLVLRLLAVLFLVLAFARPMLPHAGQTLRSGGTAVSVFVDNSFSMENGDEEGSLLDAACAKAREIAAAYSPSDRYQLLTSEMGGEEFRWLSREEFLDAVDNLEICAASRRLSEVASRQRDFLAQSGAANRHAYLVSDCQTPACDFDRLPSDSLTLFTFVPLHAVATDNVYVDTLLLDAPAFFVGGTVSVEVTVRNEGAVDVEKLPLRLYLDGRERALATLDLPAGATATASLRFTLNEAGWHDGRVELEDYPVTFDDNYFFTLLAGERVAMLEVDAHQPNAALRRLFEADSAVDYRCAPLGNDLSAFSFVALNEVERLSSGEAQQLAAWVSEGGTLLVTPPANANVEALNTLLAMLKAPRLGHWSPRAEKATAVDTRAGLYRNVFSGVSEEMEMPQVQGCYRTENGGAVRQSIITLAGGGDMLCVTPCGKGRLYLFTTPLSPEWTDFTGQALFVPTLYNMALYSQPVPVASHTLGSQAPIFLQGRYDAAAAPVALTGDKDFSVIPDLRKVAGRTVLQPHCELSHAGHYRLGDEHLAFNYDRMESRMEFLSRDEVVAQLKGRGEYTVVRNARKPLDTELRSRMAGRPLWRVCLLLALLVLAVETALLRLTPQVVRGLKDDWLPKALASFKKLFKNR